MGLFRKKKIYKVVWRYDAICSTYTEIIKAYDMADAWSRVRKQHGIPIDLVEIERLV